MDDGRWTMDDGRWTMDDGRWTRAGGAGERIWGDCFIEEVWNFRILY